MIIKWLNNQPVRITAKFTRMVNGKKETLKIEDRRFKPNQYIWPFHESTLKVEPGLKQNPGY